MDHVSGDVAGRLVAENALVIGRWAEALRPAARFLLPKVAACLLEEGRGAANRRTITQLYWNYARGRPDGSPSCRVRVPVWETARTPPPPAPAALSLLPSSFRRPP